MISLSISAQGIREEIMKSFEGKAVWITAYSGILDETNRINLFLADDGNTYIAKSLYPSSGEIINYERSMVGETLVLTEYKDLREIGSYFLKKDGDNLKGVWKQVNGSSIDVQFIKSQNEMECGDMHFLHYLKADNDDRLMIFRNHEIPKVMLHGKLVSVTCKSPDCQKLILEDAEGNSLGVLKKLKWADWVYQNNGKEQTFYKQHGYTYACEEYTSYNQLWSVEYPVLDNEDFNKWINGALEDIRIERPASLKADGIADRYHEKIKNWVEVTFYDENFISGYIYAQSSMKTEVAKRSFIFDIKDKKEVDRSDIFNKSISALTGNEDLIYIVLTKHGIELSSDFNPIYGEQEFQLTFAKARPLLDHKRLRKTCGKYE